MDTKKVLIVDDEKDLTMLIAEILQQQGGYEIAIAYDGEEAVEKIKAVAPHIIFLDFVMPTAKGDHVLDFVSKNCNGNDLSIVLMSGLGEMVYFKRKDVWRWLPNSDVAKNRGEIPESLVWKRSPEEIVKEFKVKAFLAKPFSRSTLLEVLAAVQE